MGGRGSSKPVDVGSLSFPLEAGLEGGEGWCKVAPPLHTHTNDTLHLWWCELLAQTFLVVELFSPFPSGCLFTANSCLLPGLLSKSHFPAPIPCCTWRRKTQAGVCRAAAKSIHLGLTLSCLSQTSYCIPVWSLEAPSLCQLIHPQ